MKQKQIFYEHLTFREEIKQTLRGFDMTIEEHIEILKVSDETMHLEILDIILTSLPKEKHAEFLEKMHQNPHDRKLIDYLKIHDSEIEIKIKDRAGKVKKEILSEIKRALKK